MIQIYSILTGWKEVDETKARKFVNNLLRTIVTMSNDNKIHYIEKHRLRGTTVKKLFEKQ